MRAPSRRVATAGGVVTLALLAYVPALLSSPDRLPADTKLYLYLDPGRLISDAPWTFDARQFAGWVPHQIIAYLWPQGPWYWLGAGAGLPEWVVHRLWIGTLFLAAGTGVLWMARRLGLGLTAALAAAAVYQFTPYILPYVSRTSAMLLAWAGLGWIVGLTAAAATRTTWRHAALVALVIVTVGAVNATALMMIAPAPVLWLLSAVIGGLVTWRRAITTALRIGLLSLGVSLWWIVAVSIQGRLGAPVLKYSESLESVSYTSTSTEVWRNLGYWLTYVRDAWNATTTAGRDYMVSGRVIVTGFALLIVGIVGIVATRWVHRRFAALLVATGVVLAVGVHPIDDPSPLMRLLRGDGESGAALALRSSTRAVPMLVLGLALGAGALVDAAGTFRLRSGVSRASLRASERRSSVPWRPILAVAVALLAVANLPSLTGRRLVDPAIDHDEHPPAAWQEATAALDAGDTRARVLQLPGQEFGAFRWGYTVDPPLPGMTNKPLVTRDLLPLGSAPAMDLLFALDDRFQTGTADPAEIAPVARLLGADTIWITGDAAFERFRTPRPALVADLFSGGVPGTGQTTTYGEAVPNVAPDTVDEQSVSDPRAGQPVAPVSLVPITDAVPVVRAKDDVVLVAGSGDGLIDAAGAGLIDGSELIRYTGSLTGDALADAAAAADQIIVTDSNRDRAHQWRGSQDVIGFTEDGDPATPDLLRRDPADQRLPVFGDVDAPATIAVQDGPMIARASAYGEPFAYRPEDRAVMAIDGDATTAWRVADRSDPIGEQLQLDVSEPIDHLTLTQPQGAAALRHLGAITITIPGREPQRVELGPDSLGEGQRVDIAPTTGPTTVTITIDEVVVPDATIGPALAAVGFAEVDAGLGPTVEVVEPPSDAAAAVAAAADSTPISYVFTRLRTRPTDRWRSDPEPTMVRRFDVPTARTFVPEITVRLDQRASDEVLATLLGITGPHADRRLTGAASAAGWALADGDPATAWTTPFSGAVGSSVTVTTTAPTAAMTITQSGGDHSPITGLRFTAGSVTADVTVPPADASGASTIAFPETLPAGPVQVTILGVDPHVVLDRRYGEPVVEPAAIAQLSGITTTTIPVSFDSGCRDDLITIDGRPLPVRVQGTTAALFAGDPVVAEPCDGSTLQLATGGHLLATAKGLDTGLDIDRVVLAAPGRLAPGAAGDGPTATVTSQSRTGREITVDGCPDGCWLVLGEGFHDSWSASTTSGDLGAPQLVDGGFNGWWIPPSDGPVAVSVHWTAQTPLTIALILTALAILACIVLVVVDRRSAPAAVTAPPTLAPIGRPIPVRRRWIAAATWVVAAVLVVGPGWGLVAALAAAVLLVVLGRPRAAGWLSVGMLVVMGAVVTRVVRSEHPYPDAGWPVRFEWLHGLGLFAAVSLAVVAFSGRRAEPDP